MRANFVHLCMAIAICVLCSNELLAQANRPERLSPPKPPSATVVKSPSDSVDLKQLELDWNQKCDAMPRVDPRQGEHGDRGQRYRDEFELLVRLLDEHVADQHDYRCMVSFLSQQGDPNDSPEFEGIEIFVETATKALTELLCRRGDRATLVELFARRCPDASLMDPIEKWLAIQGNPSFRESRHGLGIRDGILVLCDAYDRSTIPAVRSGIAKVLLRGFRPYVVDRSDEAKAVAECREWYLKNRADFEINLGYAEEFGMNGSLAEAYRQLSRDVPRDYLFVARATKAGGR